MSVKAGDVLRGKDGGNWAYGTYIVNHYDSVYDEMDIVCISHEYDDDEVEEEYSEVQWDEDDFEILGQDSSKTSTHFAMTASISSVDIVTALSSVKTLNQTDLLALGLI